MSYQTHPGIVLINICDTNLLVATRAHWEQFPVVRPIPKLWAACWKILESGKTEQDVIHAFASLLRKSENEVSARLKKIFETLAAEGLLIESEEKDH